MLKYSQSNYSDEWKIIELGDMFEFKNGLNKEKSYFGTGTPIINYSDVYSGGGIHKSSLKGKVRVSKLEIVRFNVLKGDVFFTRTSETLEEIGQAAVALDDFEDTVFSGFVIRARQKNIPILYFKFAKYCFKTPNLRREIKNKSSYTTRALTSGYLLKQVKLSLPSLKEQKRIVSVLETWDRTIELLTKIIENKKQIRKGLMKYLLDGRKRLLGFIDKWQLRSLGEIASIHKGSQLNKEDMKGGAYPVINGGISASGFTDQKNSDKDCITVSEGGNSCGYVNYITSDFWLGGHCYALNENDKYFKMFLYYLLKFNELRLMSLRVGSGLPNIQLHSLKNYKVKCAIDFDEQKAIAKILTTADEEIKAQQKKLSLLKQQKKYLLNNLVSGAIRTPVDLLSRIKE